MVMYISQRGRYFSEARSHISISAFLLSKGPTAIVLLVRSGNSCPPRSVCNLEAAGIANCLKPPGYTSKPRSVQFIGVPVTGARHTQIQALPDLITHITWTNEVAASATSVGLIAPGACRRYSLDLALGW